MPLIRALYNFIIQLSNHPYAHYWLFIVAFVESSFFPIPPDVMLIPMCLAAPKKAFKFWIIATIGSVLGGMLGYVIGWALFDEIGKPLLLAYGFENGLELVQTSYDEHGWWLVLLSAVTPLPYKLFTIASGALSLNFPIFILTSLLGRGTRFAIVCYLLYKFGAPIQDFIEKKLGLVTLVALGLLIGGFLWFGVQYG